MNNTQRPYDSLINAINEHDVETIKQLQCGCIDLIDQHCLYVACRTSSFETIKAIVECGSDNIQFLYLRDAAFYCGLDSVQYLIEYGLTKGLDITQEIHQALGSASKKNNIELIKYFLTVGADVRFNRSYAIRSILTDDHLETLEYFFSIADKKDPNWQDVFGEAFIFAANVKKDNVVKLFLQHGMSIKWLEQHANQFGQEYVKNFKTEKFFHQLDKTIKEKDIKNSDNIDDTSTEKNNTYHKMKL